MAASERHLRPTTRFSDRVELYLRYRPRYPAALLDSLQQACGLTPEAVIADIGSGTGFLAELFLLRGHVVFGVEPNPEMRQAAETYLARFPNFHSVAGQAEATTLPGASVDVVTAAQAFHWFEPDAARAEFGRILRSTGWVVLLWNERRTDATPFLRDYEELLLTYGSDYAEVDHRRIEAAAPAALFGGPYEVRKLDSQQILDWDGLRGRLLSSSYAPLPGHPNHAPMMKMLAELFRRHARHGRVVLRYHTRVYFGRLGG